MADINRSLPYKAQTRGRKVPAKKHVRAVAGDRRAQTQPVLEDTDVVSLIELLFFAYRDFTAEPDALLEEFGFGRAHHRVLHFVSRNPGLRVANLLDILNITKQSLARVLKQLIDEGFVVQKAGAEDRRERLLFVTGKGARLIQTLTDLQATRIRAALSDSGPGSSETARQFLMAMVAEVDRDTVRDLIRFPISSDNPAISNQSHRKEIEASSSELTEIALSASDLPPSRAHSGSSQKE